MMPRSLLHSLRSACLGFAFVGSITCASGSARAQAPIAAKAQYRRALEAIGKQNWAEARDLLLPLWNEKHTYDVAAALGQAEFNLKDYAAGTQHMAFAAANIPVKEKVAIVERIQGSLAEMKRSVGIVVFSVNKDGAEITVDGQTVGSSPLSTEIYVNPGTRVLEARLTDGSSAKQTIEVVPGKTYNVGLLVEKAEKSAVTAAPIAPGTSTAPVLAQPEPAPTAAPPPIESAARPNWTPVLITGGLTVVALAVGTGFALDASSAKADGDSYLKQAQSQFGGNPCTQPSGASSGVCTSLQAQEDRRSHSMTGATISFVAGGVFAASTVVSYFVWATPKSASAPIDAWVGPAGAGLRLQGSF